MIDKINILFIEDNPSDTELIRSELHKEKIQFSDKVVETKQDYLEALHAFTPDIIISDYSLPRFDGMQALIIRNTLMPAIPFILVTGSIDELVAFNCLKAGADDYLFKQNLSRLGSAVKTALRQKDLIRQNEMAERLLLESEEKYRSIFENSNVCILLTIPDGTILAANDYTCQLFGLTEEEICLGGRDAIVDKTDPRLQMILDERKRTGTSKGEITLIRKDGTKFEGEVSSTVFTGMDGKEKASMVIQDLSERKHAEEQLIFKNIILSTQQEASPDGILVVSKNGIIISFNQRFIEIMGIPGALIHNGTDEPVLQFVTDLMADRGQFLKRVQYINEKKRETSHDELLLKDGRILERYSSPMFKSEDQYYGRVWYFRDITYRKNSEDALRASETQYKTLTEFAPVGIFATDVNGVTTYVNPRWCQISRMKAGDAMGDGWLNAVHPLDRSKITEIWKHDAITRTTSFSQYRFLHPDDSVTWVKGQAVPQRDHNGNVTGYIGTIIDITDIKRAEEKLIESESYYRTLIDISPDGIITSDLQGRVTYGSKKAYELFEEPTEISLIGKSLLNWVDPGYHEVILNRIKDIISGKDEPVTREYKLLKHDRSVFWGEVSSSVLATDQSGTAKGLLIVCRDISERKKAEEELILARDKAEEGDRLKTAFLHNISHEIRTPMNAIVGFSALLGEPDLDDEMHKSYIEVIMHSSDHLLSIVNDIIEISNIEAGNLKLMQNKVNLNAVLQNLYNLFIASVSVKGISLNLKCGLKDNESLILTDGTKLKEIFSNLLSNALKFTDRGSITFGYTVKRKKVEFFVSDTGIGLSENQFLKIFERFYQVEHTKSRLYEGTGLGLSICKAYIELLGGEILVKSKPGEGATFHFTIPLVLSEEKIITGYPIHELLIPSVPARQTLLVAEDDEINFQLIKALLSGLNIEILHASNGIEAVNICNSDQHIDMVLMDIKMPLMDGHTATRKILENSPGMKIIAQTAFAYDEARAMEEGCSGFISKPFSKNQIINIVKEFL